MQQVADALGISVLALDALIVLLFGQAALQIYCLWHLARHPLLMPEQTRRWTFIIIFGLFVGALAYVIKRNGDEYVQRSARTAGRLIRGRPKGNDPAEH